MFSEIKGWSSSNTIVNVIFRTQAARTLLKCHDTTLLVRVYQSFSSGPCGFSFVALMALRWIVLYCRTCRSMRFLSRMFWKPMVSRVRSRLFWNCLYHWQFWRKFQKSSNICAVDYKKLPRFSLLVTWTLLEWTLYQFWAVFSNNSSDSDRSNTGNSTTCVAIWFTKGSYYRYSWRHVKIVEKGRRRHVREFLHFVPFAHRRTYPLPKVRTGFLALFHWLKLIRFSVLSNKVHTRSRHKS